MAGLDLSVAIRTFETLGDTIWFGAGGGIVTGSDPEVELAEAFTKAAGPVAAIGSRLPAPTARRSFTAHLPEPALAHGERPNPEAGVFETILIDRGRAIAVREHLERLAASVAALYGSRLDPAAADCVAAAVRAARAKGSRLRLSGSLAQRS